MSATDTGATEPIDLIALAAGEARPGRDAGIAEARRQIEICNACRYCEGYCSVFPAMTLRREFSAGDMTHLANLCHNCRGCYYACQYAPPHEFAVNLPRALAEVRTQSWAEYAWPGFLGRAFQRNGVVLSLALLASLIGFMALLGIGTPSPASRTFYDFMSHAAMVALFGSVFLFALFAMAISVVIYWRQTASPHVGLIDIGVALHDVMVLRNLRGGTGDGCNFEAEDAFTNRRWLAHQAAFYGFLLCFASTTAGTVMHYALQMPAPYGPFSLPKLLGVPGGVLLAIGTTGLLLLRRTSDPKLTARGSAGMDMAFTLLLLLAAITGLALYWLGGTSLLRPMLIAHLASVLALFVTLPYSRMVHGLYRTAALVRHAHEARTRRPME